MRRFRVPWRWSRAGTPPTSAAGFRSSRASSRAATGPSSATRMAGRSFWRKPTSTFPHSTPGRMISRIATPAALWSPSPMASSSIFAPRRHWNRPRGVSWRIWRQPIPASPSSPPRWRSSCARKPPPRTARWRIFWPARPSRTAPLSTRATTPRTSPPSPWSSVRAASASRSVRATALRPIASLRHTLFSAPPQHPQP